MNPMRHARRLVTGLALILVLLCVSPIDRAQALTVSDLPNPRRATGSWICDQADLLSPDTERQLNRRINQLVARTSAELAIATVPQLDSSQEPRAFALDLFNTWRIGQRQRHNGVLLFIAQDNRRIEIITGKGLQDVLPDPTVSQVIQQQIVPAFRQTNPPTVPTGYETGLVQGTSAIAQLLESELPSVWPTDSLPIGLSVTGGILVALGIVWSLILAFKPVRVIVPTQGFNLENFRSSSTSLSTYSLTQLLEKLFAPEAWRGQTPTWPLIWFWLGGTLLGCGIGLAVQGALLVNSPSDPLAQPLRGGSWAMGWGINTIAGSLSVWMATGLLLLIGFTYRWWNPRTTIQLLLIPLLIAAGGSWYLLQYIPTWQSFVLLLLLLNGIGMALWMFSAAEEVRMRRRLRYGNAAGQPPIELTPDQLNALLTPPEIQAVAMQHLEFRGWRDPAVNPPLTREQVYLVQRQAPSTTTCPECQGVTVERSTRRVEKPYPLKPDPPTKKSKSKSKSKARAKPHAQPPSTESAPVPQATRIVDQVVYTCHFCGHVQIYEPGSSVASDSDYSSSQEAAIGSSYESDSYSSYDPYDRNSYDHNVSDFGGGSSDGGGSGSDW